MDTTVLSALSPGESGIILSVAVAQAERLRDLGLIEGTRVRCELRTRRGNIAAYFVRGCLLALRREDAGEVAICPAR